MVANDIPGAENLERRIYPMPPDVRRALEQRGVMHHYRQRPAYQQNDYVGWIIHAKRPQTRKKRLAQMLEELEGGRLYMNMKWEARKR